MREVGNDAVDRLHHQVDVDAGGDAVVAKRLAHQRADRQVRDVVVVHHVEVNEVGAGGEHCVYLFAETGEIRRKDRRGNPELVHRGPFAFDRAGWPLRRTEAERRELLERVDDGVGSRLGDVPAVVVAVAHACDAHPGRAGGPHVVDRVADEQGVSDRHAELGACMEQRQRIGLAARKRVAADDQLQGVAQSEVCEQVDGRGAGLVGDAGEGRAVRAKGGDPGVHPRVDPAAIAAVPGVQVQEHAACLAEQRGLRPSVHGAGQGALDEPFHAVADPSSHERLAARRNAEPWHRAVDAPCEVGNRVDEGSVEIERDESGWRSREHACPSGRFETHWLAIVMD